MISTKKVFWVILASMFGLVGLIGVQTYQVVTEAEKARANALYDWAKDSEEKSQYASLYTQVCVNGILVVSQNNEIHIPQIPVNKIERPATYEECLQHIDNNHSTEIHVSAQDRLVLLNSMSESTNKIRSPVPLRWL